MYLTQGTSTLLFTIIRLTLQGSLIFFISHLASTTHNLTYQERINGSFISSIQYLLFTKFSPRREHRLGRFYVALALVVTFALNYLPTLLSDLYPVLPTFLPSNLEEFNISTAFVKSTSLIPNETSVENILLSIGTPLKGSKFDTYIAPTAERGLCKFEGDKMNCTHGDFEFNGFSYNASLVVGPQFGLETPPRLQNGTTSEGGHFQFYNATDTTGFYGLAEAFMNAGTVWANHYNDMSHSNPRSLEGCLQMNYIGHRCVRHSLGYMLSKDLHLFVITRRVYTVSFAQSLNITVNTTFPDFIDPNINTVLNCAKLPTSTLETMCKQINSLGVPPLFRLYTMQSQSVDQNDRVHWDVVTTRIMFQPDDASMGYSLLLSLEAFHLDAGAESYNNIIDKDRSKLAINNEPVALARFLGRETFEATYIVSQRAVSPFNHSWIDWGFSQEDIHNLTAFLLGGTMLNSGRLMVRKEELLANVSNITVICLFGASVIMVGLGLLLSQGVDSAVRDPITEVLPKVLESKRLGASKNKNMSPLRCRRVAHLTLVSSPASTINNPPIDPFPATASSLAPNSSLLLHVEACNDGNRTVSVNNNKALLLRMETDSDDDGIDVFELFENRKGHAPSSSDVQEQGSNSAALRPETRRHSITQATFP